MWSGGEQRFHWAGHFYWEGRWFFTGKLLELNFLIRKFNFTGWSNQEGKIFLPASQFACCSAMNETGTREGVEVYCLEHAVV